MREEPNNNYTGIHRHIVLASIAKAQGKEWSSKNGLVEATGAVISQDPKEIVRTLLPGYSGDPEKLSIYSILEYVYTKYQDQPDQIERLVGEAAEILAEEHGVMMPMPNEQAVHEANDADEYFLARLRDRIVVQDMEPLFDSSRQLYKEYVVENKLRDMNHLEDLVLEEGPKGLSKSLQILRAFAEGDAHASTTIKWDGSPAIVFGRDANGQFILTDKHGWQAKGYDGKAKTKQELQAMIANRKVAMDDSRQQFVANMGDIFEAYEKATPQDFRGFLSGDLMYYSTPALEDTFYAMQPNTVRYEVSKDSKLGQAIGGSKTGVVVHNYAGNMYGSPEEALKHINTGEVLVIPPTYVPHASSINTSPIDKLEAFTNKHAAGINDLFNPAGLKGIANVHQLFYKYINTCVDTGLENLGDDFTQWLSTQNLTDQKRNNIIAYLKTHKKSVNALWTIIQGIMKLKDYLVHEFDSHPSDVKQTTAGQPGGEGYVVKTKQGPVKLVSRGKFTAANRAQHR